MHDYGGNWTERSRARGHTEGTGPLGCGALHWWRDCRARCSGRFGGGIRFARAPGELQESNEDRRAFFWSVERRGRAIGRDGRSAGGRAGAGSALLLCAEAPRFEAMAPSLAISVNQEYSGAERVLREGDEVGLLPPVSGGSSGHGHVPRKKGEVALCASRSMRRPWPSAEASRGWRGGDFRGRGARQHARAAHALSGYEAYEAMALKQMESLAAEARARFGVRGASIVHRLGRLEIGETSVLIVVAAAHRGAAFEACRWIIDTLKKTVPIWKKEYFEDGAVWADGEAFPEEIRRREAQRGSSLHPNE
jgi:MoaE-MoaD fusion protein